MHERNIFVLETVFLTNYVVLWKIGFISFPGYLDNLSIILHTLSIKSPKKLSNSTTHDVGTTRLGQCSYLVSHPFILLFAPPDSTLEVSFTEWRVSSEGA